ncbi:MAG: hypothetical protein H7Z40_09980 [Phycisphaerae bacterium]|nr:hypothetical protein [Gemmatimonadaceae bacterium]
MQRENLTLGGLLTRYAVAALLVYGTWNPEGYSFWHWAISPIYGGPATPGPAPLKFLVGILLVTAWGIFLNATRRSLGLPGAILTLAILGGVIWLLVDLNWVSAESPRGIAHVALIAVSILLCAGMSWSFISRRLSGQVDTDVTE